MNNLERVIVQVAEASSRVGGETISRKAFLAGLAVASLGALPRSLSAGGGQSCESCCVWEPWWECCEGSGGEDGCPDDYPWKLAEGTECYCPTPVCWDSGRPGCNGVECCDCVYHQGEAFTCCVKVGRGAAN